MADNTGRCNSYRKMFGGEDNPFLKMMGEANVPFSTSVKQIVTQSIESGEKWIGQAFALNEKATEWAKDTPLAPVFETQRSVARQVFASSTALARQLWQLEQPVEEVPQDAQSAQSAQSA